MLSTIMNRKPSIPREGTRKRMSTMRELESSSMYFRELTCWLRPLSMPSTTLSTYMMGIRGASTSSRKPTSSLL